jgi:hypothetical protein
MKTEQEYIKDLSEIRSMMERSSKFMSLSGLSGIMAGIYALVGAYIAYRVFYTVDPTSGMGGALMFQDKLTEIFLVGAAVLVLAIGTAVMLSRKKSKQSGEKLWNAVSRRLTLNMAVPLATGGIVVLILLAKGLTGYIAATTLIFYGLALFNASKFTFVELRSLALVEIGLGLIAFYLTGYGLLIWALGFGLLHILYGIYMHLKYEK